MGGGRAQFLTAGTWIWLLQNAKVGLYLKDKIKQKAFGNIKKRGGKSVSVGKQTPLKWLEPSAPSYRSLNWL